jgi:hypothetical protein
MTDGPWPPPAGRPLTRTSRAWLAVNLTRLAGFAALLEVSPSTVASWRDRYAGFPEPVLPADRRNSGAVYWLPDLMAFTAANGLPDARYMLATRKDRGEPHRWSAASSDQSEVPQETGDRP